jgi:predicted metal-dependent phosphoesterase TrpH
MAMAVSCLTRNPSTRTIPANEPIIMQIWARRAKEAVLQAASVQMSPVGGVDLHMHTTTSDGDLSATRIVDLLRAAKVQVAAITDHDAMASARNSVLWKYLDALGPNAPQMVPGVEITCSMTAPLVDGGSQMLDVVGLGCDPQNLALRKALTRQRLGTAARVRDCVEKLRADGYDLSYGKLGRVAGLRAVDVGILDRAVVRGGYAPDCETARNEIINPHLADYRGMPQRFTMDAQDAIALIHAAGGVAILAHPQRVVTNHDPKILKGLFADLASKGLDAVEAYRFDLEKEKQPLYRSLIKEVGLLVSGGSDYHYPNEKGVKRHPGDAGVPCSVWAAFKQLIEKRGGFTDIRDVRVARTKKANAAERFRLS